MAEPIEARHDGPRFDNSAVDGYAVRASDLLSASPEAPVILPVVGTLAAGGGDAAVRPLLTAVRIFTGARLPAGADAVVMQEEAQRKDEGVEFVRPAQIGANIRVRGEEYRAGAPLVPAGAVLSPPRLALLAEQGTEQARVHMLPRVAIVATGRELAPCGSTLKPGQIYASNGVGLASAVEDLGLPVVFETVIGDEKGATRETLDCALARADVLITSGGVSIGDCDVVKDALESLDVETVLWRVAMKPGKPFFFGVRKRQWVFALPGNPVAAFVTFQTLVRPALLRLAGHEAREQTYRATLDGELGPVGGRTEFVRGVSRLEDGRLRVGPLACQGSSMTTGLAAADCLIHRKPGSPAAERGDEVEITLLNWTP